MSSYPHIKGYEIAEKLGMGTYSNVYKAFIKGTRDAVAIKCVLKANLEGSAVDNIITEIRMLKTLKHEHIVEMKDFKWDDRYIYIIMEYCSRGDLSSFIKKRKALSEATCRVFLQQLALALRYLRSQNVSHMDLKPQNLLLVHSPRLMLKVGDFGFASHLPPDTEQTSLRGSPLYMAPEVLLKGRYDAKADLWAVGVILYESLFGKAPYSSKTLAELLDKVKHQAPIDIPVNCRVSSDCSDLLKRLLQPDPQNRISFEEFFAHEFLDLEHAPCKDSYSKAVDLIQKAVAADSTGSYEQAFNLYCDALKYFVPVVTIEPDVVKKQALRLRVNEYIHRAEQLQKTMTELKSAQSANSNSKQPKQSGPDVQTLVTPGIDFKRLESLSKTSPAITSALDQGRTGALYAAEGAYNNALTNLKGALSILVPLLTTEPRGERRDLLHAQILQWMSQAEIIQNVLAVDEMKDCNNRESRDHCLLQ